VTTRASDETWDEFAADARDLIAQADRRLARAGATKALRIARDRLERNVLFEEQSGRRTPSKIAPWRFELRVQLARDLVRGEPEAHASRLHARRIQPGMRVRFTPPGLPQIEGTVFQVVGTRAKVAPEDGGRAWSIPVDELEVVEGANG